MGLTLSDMDSFTLEELDDFSLEELDNMSYVQLLTAVQSKYQIADKQCNKDIVLSDAQIETITSIVRTYTKDFKPDPLLKVVTTGIAINAIWDFLKFVSATTARHLPEIIDALKQAYILLDQLIHQMPK